MVKLEFHENFKGTVSKIKDGLIKERLEKLLVKIKKNPEIGKPMMNARKGTREVYVSPFRLSYAYFKDEDKIILLDFYHKDE